MFVRKEQLGCHSTDFHEIQNIFRKYVEKIQVSLKSDENNGHITLRSVYTYDISLTSSSFYRTSVANVPNVLQPYWLIVLPLDVPDLTASLLL